MYRQLYVLSHVSFTQQKLQMNILSIYVRLSEDLNNYKTISKQVNRYDTNVAAENACQEKREIVLPWFMLSPQVSCCPRVVSMNHCRFHLLKWNNAP